MNVALDRELTVLVTAGRGHARLPVLRRAVAGACSKAGLPVDRMDDAGLILDALLADSRVARAAEVHLVLSAQPGSFALMLGPLADSEAERLLEQARLPVVGPVIERLATSAVTVDGGSHLLIFVDAA